jgi:hypothetical protein
MSFGAKLAGSVAIFAAAGSLLALPACSSNSPRDINWGTDVGVGFEPPDTGAVGDRPDTTTTNTTIDATVEDSEDSADSISGEVSIDESQDEAVFDLDAAIDGAN